ncbi:hypothetical protein ACFQ9X_12995 [Catenulispora yoronensis]
MPLNGATGALIVAAAEEDLAVLGGALEILARQASSALERIKLSQEITRRDSEAYFRALVQNTSDTILIVDSELRVRYASPPRPSCSAAARCGTGSSPRRSARSTPPTWRCAPRTRRRSRRYAGTGRSAPAAGRRTRSRPRSRTCAPSPRSAASCCRCTT